MHVLHDSVFTSLSFFFLFFTFFFFLLFSVDSTILQAKIMAQSGRELFKAITGAFRGGYKLFFFNLQVKLEERNLRET